MKLSDYISFLAIVVIGGLAKLLLTGGLHDSDWTDLLVIAAMVTTINAIRSTPTTGAQHG